MSKLENTKQSKVYFYDGIDEITRVDLSKIKIKKHPNIRFATTYADKNPFFEAMSAKSKTKDKER